MEDKSLTVILLAGSRPGSDPLAIAAGEELKALVPICGRPMIDHVARVLANHARVGRIVVMAQKPEQLVAHPQTRWLADHSRISLHSSGEGISQSLIDWLETNPHAQPALVTTADNVLISADMIDSFLAGVGDADIAAAMVERATLMSAYPESRRTWLKTRGGAWSGANLFWLGGEKARHALRKWREIEQDRKKGWRIALALGPLLLLGAGLRVITIHQAVARAGRVLGLKARVVPLPYAEACIDADKPEDVVLIERILARRAGA